MRAGVNGLTRLKPDTFSSKATFVNLTSAIPRRWVDAVLLAITIIGLWHVVRTVTLALPSWHVDGAFQTASGLFRLNDGQFPGRDFFPYLGMAAVYVLFPLFKLAGADLAASTSAA